MKSPDPADKQVGDRLRLQRIALGMSLEGVAEEVGSTLQQVQQWESGADPVGAAYLRRLSTVLAVDLSYFFSAAPTQPSKREAEAKDAARPRSLLALAASVEDLRLIHAFANIKNAGFREIVIRLAEAMAETEIEGNPGLSDA